MLFLANILLFGSGLSHALNSPAVETISGVQVVPGPGILGIQATTDIIRNVESIMPNSSVPGRSVARDSTQSALINCYDGSSSSTVQDAQLLMQYLKSLTPSKECSIQQSQYRADCALGACVALATANTATMYMCLEPGESDGISFASVNCNTVGNYVSTLIQSCSTGVSVFGLVSVDPSDYSASNNALGTNARGAQDAFFLLG